MTTKTLTLEWPGALRRFRERWRLSRSGRKTLWFYIFVSPWLIGFIFLTILPLLGGLGFSFTNYDGLNFATMKMVGLRNYTRLLNDSKAIQAFWATVKFTLINVPVTIIVSFVLAFVLNRAIKGQGLFRTLFYLPTLVPIVAVVWIFKIFLSQFGPLNSFIDILFPGTAILWIGQKHAIATVTGLSVWMSFGTGMVIFLAGLQGVPRELEEAALIDGANLVQSMWHVTVPLMTPMIFFLLILNLIGSFQELVRPILLWSDPAGAGMSAMPSKSAYFIMVHVYRQIFIESRFGYGVAILWVTFAILMILALFLFWSSRYWVYYEEDVEEAGS